MTTGAVGTVCVPAVPDFCFGGDAHGGVTKEQIARAKEWDLLTYLRVFEPQELVRSGPNEYCTRTHDSLKISHGKWCWNSREIGGRTALDYLIKVRGVSFVEAVETLCGNHLPPRAETRPPAKQRPFALPEASRWPSTVVPYLQDRGIDPEIINVCLGAGTLYESRNYRNCVFVGYDIEGRARFACLRGTSGNFKRDVPGSDKRFSFCIHAADPDCPRLAVAESPIDALSLATLVKRSGGDWKESGYLSLGGTSPRAVLQYLYDHPGITQISLCLDNDRAGMEGMERIERAIRQEPTLSRRVSLIFHNPPSRVYGKDYNEMLVTQMDRRQSQGQQFMEVR